MTTRALQVHDFRESSRRQVGDLTVLHGTIAQTLLCQSPEIAEYGYRYSPDEVRDEPALEQVFRDMCVVLDLARHRTSFTGEEAAALWEFIGSAAVDDDDDDNDDVSFVVFFRGLDLSGTGGLWRSNVRDAATDARAGSWHQLGLEALTALVLTAKLVYLEFAPDLDWKHATYLA